MFGTSAPESISDKLLEDKYPRIQILTIEDLLAGKQVAHPRRLDATLKKAPKSRPAAEKKLLLPFEVGTDLRKEVQADDEAQENPETPEGPF